MVPQVWTRNPEWEVEKKPQGADLPISPLWMSGCANWYSLYSSDANGTPGLEWQSDPTILRYREVEFKAT